MIAALIVMALCGLAYGWAGIVFWRLGGRFLSVILIAMSLFTGFCTVLAVRA